MPDTPIITQTQFTSYPVITEYGVKINAKVSINYGTRTDVNNLYSIDNGNTWQEYTGEFECNAIYVMAKSEKKVSGLYASSKKQLVVTASDALGTSAYDGNNSTYVSLGDGVYSKRINVDESMIDKKIHFYLYQGKTSIYVNFYSSTGTQLNSYFWGGSTATHYRDFNAVVPEGTKYIQFKKDDYDGAYQIYEVQPVK